MKQASRILFVLAICISLAGIGSAQIATFPDVSSSNSSDVKVDIENGTVDVFVGSTFEIPLIFHRGTLYKWHLENSFDHAVLALVSNLSDRIDGQEKLGGRDRTTWIFRGQASGTTNLKFSLDTEQPMPISTSQVIRLKVTVHGK